MRSCLDGLRILKRLDPYNVYFHARSIVRRVTRDGDLLIGRFVEGKQGSPSPGLAAKLRLHENREFGKFLVIAEVNPRSIANDEAWKNEGPRLCDSGPGVVEKL